jgi:hypothetical protein
MELTECSEDLIEVNVAARAVELTTNHFSAGLEAKVLREGRVSAPRIVLQGVMRMLPYFGRQTIEIGFSEGKMRVHTTIFHHWMIGVGASPACGRRHPPARSRDLSSVMA